MPQKLSMRVDGNTVGKSIKLFEENMLRFSNIKLHFKDLNTIYRLLLDNKQVDKSGRNYFYATIGSCCVMIYLDLILCRKYYQICKTKI